MRSEALGTGSGEWGPGPLSRPAACGQLPPTQGLASRTSLSCESRCTFLSREGSQAAARPAGAGGGGEFNMEQGGASR